jgi:hypothetical protein
MRDRKPTTPASVIAIARNAPKMYSGTYNKLEFCELDAAGKLCGIIGLPSSIPEY